VHDYTETYILMVFLGILTLCLVIGILSMAYGVAIRALFQNDFGRTLIRFGAVCVAIFFIFLPLSLKRLDVFFGLIAVLMAAGIGMRIARKTKGEMHNHSRAGHKANL